MFQKSENSPTFSLNYNHHPSLIIPNSGILKIESLEINQIKDLPLAEQIYITASPRNLNSIIG